MISLKKKGFTLIELIITLSIISIIISVSFISYTAIKNKKVEMAMAYDKLTIHKFINNARIYCISMESSGLIGFNFSSNYMYFSYNNKIIDRFYLTNGNKLDYVNRSFINFDKTGFTKDSCTITLKDSLGKYHIITISVGSGNVEIK